MSGVSSTASVESRRSISRQTIVLGCLSLLFVLITIFLMSQLRSGTVGPRGEQGPAGPAGPAGQAGTAATIDPHIQELVSTLAKIRWLDDEIKRFEESAATYVQNIEPYIDMVRTEARSLHPGINPRAIRDSEAQNITNLAKEALGTDENLNAMPNFINNRFCCEKAGEIFSSEKIREDVNRVTDQLNTARLTIENIRQRLLLKRGEYMNPIMTFALGRN
jgi:hypothetical protein